jgi:hypothetical protein
MSLNNLLISRAVISHLGFLADMGKMEGWGGGSIFGFVSACNVADK